MRCVPPGVRSICARLTVCLWICLATLGSRAALALATVQPQKPAAAPPATSLRGIHKIRHVVIIMQENRSFDSYFGTFPGAEGIPMAAGNPAVCAPDPRSGRCVAPSHDPRALHPGGP
jgi:phospholipase C